MVPQGTSPGFTQAILEEEEEEDDKEVDDVREKQKKDNGSAGERGRRACSLP